MLNLKSSAIAPLAALAVLLGIAASVSSRGADNTEDRISDKLATGAIGERNKRCASPRTYEAIQQELFRQAADTRGSDEAAFGQISNYSVVRMERPLLRSFDQELGTVRCSGKLTLQLPRGTAVVGGRQALAAEIDYVLQPAADGSGDVVMLEGETPITVPLATLARTGSYPELSANREQLETPAVVVASGPVKPEPLVRSDPALPPRTAAKARTPQAAQPVAKPASELASPSPGSAKPSFNCRYARTRGEVSVCSNSGLASLDRRMAGDYYRAVAAASSNQRDALRSSRNAFLRKRDRCATEACMSATYRDRMNEIGAIMSSH